MRGAYVAPLRGPNRSLFNLHGLIFQLFDVQCILRDTVMSNGI